MKNLSFIADEYSDQNAATISDWFDAAFAEFENDPIFDELTECEKEDGGFMLNCFFDYCYGYHLAGPADIDINIIDDVCLGIMPRKVSASAEAFETFAPTATRFLQWCERQGFLSKITVLCDYITQVSPRMVTNSEDPGNWGMAKSFVLGNLFDAYEPDEDSPEPAAQILPLGSVLSSKDAGLPGKPRLKVGRNTSCPCGSGKKYVTTQHVFHHFLIDGWIAL